MLALCDVDIFTYQLLSKYESVCSITPDSVSILLTGSDVDFHLIYTSPTHPSHVPGGNNVTSKGADLATIVHRECETKTRKCIFVRCILGKGLVRNIPVIVNTATGELDVFDFLGPQEWTIGFISEILKVFMSAPISMSILAVHPPLAHCTHLQHESLASYRADMENLGMDACVMWRLWYMDTRLNNSEEHGARMVADYVSNKDNVLVTRHEKGGFKRFILNSLEYMQDVHRLSCQHVDMTDTNSLNVPCIESTTIADGNRDYLSAKFIHTRTVLDRSTPPAEVCDIYNDYGRMDKGLNVKVHQRVSGKFEDDVDDFYDARSDASDDQETKKGTSDGWWGLGNFSFSGMALSAFETLNGLGQPETELTPDEEEALKLSGGEGGVLQEEYEERKRSNNLKTMLPPEKFDGQMKGKMAHRVEKARLRYDIEVKRIKDEYVAGMSKLHESRPADTIFDRESTKLKEKMRDQKIQAKSVYASDLSLSDVVINKSSELYNLAKAAYRLIDIPPEQYASIVEKLPEALSGEVGGALTDLLHQLKIFLFFATGWLTAVPLVTYHAGSRRSARPTTKTSR